MYMIARGLVQALPIKFGGVKFTLWTQTSSLSKIMWSCRCFALKCQPSHITRGTVLLYNVPIYNFCFYKTFKPIKNIVLWKNHFVMILEVKTYIICISYSKGGTCCLWFHADNSITFYHFLFHNTKCNSAF
jgi:hypothetical protein